MDNDNRERLEGAAQAIASMIDRSEKAQAKFAPGTSQHSLQRNRIHALAVALSLVRNELNGTGGAGAYTQEDLEKAGAPIASLISKSEKARQKLAPGSWQHRMLGEHLDGLYTAAPLLAKALDSLSP